MDVDFSLISILSSRICHDLIGPAGSLNFAINILQDEIKDNSLGDNPEALEIAVDSMTNLLNRLSFFRVAFGSSSVGADASGFAKVKELINNLFLEKNTVISWSDDIDDLVLNYANNDNYKFFMNIFFVIFNAIQKDAVINLYARDIKNQLGLAISVISSDISLGQDNEKALLLEISKDKVNPRNIHAYYTGLWAKKINVNLELYTNSSEIRVAFAYSKA